MKCLVRSQVPLTLNKKRPSWQKNNYLGEDERISKHFFGAHTKQIWKKAVRGWGTDKHLGQDADGQG